MHIIASNNEDWDRGLVCAVGISKPTKPDVVEFILKHAKCKLDELIELNLDEEEFGNYCEDNQLDILCAGKPLYACETIDGYVYVAMEVDC